MSKRILFIPLLLIAVLLVVFIVNKGTFLEKEDYFKSDTLSMTGVVSHIEGRQDLHLGINSKVKAGDMLWVIATPEKPEENIRTPLENSELFNKELSSEEGFGFGDIEYGEDWESLFLYDFRSFAPDEDAYSWAKEKGHNPEKRVLEKYKDKGWYITLIEMTSEPLNKLIEDFDKETEEDITRDNLVSEMINLLSEAFMEKDFEKYQSVTDYFVTFPDTSMLSKEEFMEAAATLKEGHMEALKPKLEEEFEELITELPHYNTQEHDEQEYSFVPPVRLSFESDNPVYPMEVINSFSGIESVELSLYVLSDTPVEEPEGWSVDLRRKVDASWAHPITSEYTRSDAFLLMMDRTIQTEDIDGDLIFDFNRGASENYLEKPSIEHNASVYGKEREKIIVYGTIDSAGGVDEVDVWLEWGEEDFENKSEKQTYNVREKEGTIGVEIAMEDREVIVVSSLEGSSAHREGLQRGDKILKVDGHSVEGMNTRDVGSMIRGEEGTEVSLTILRDEEEKQVMLTREINTEELRVPVSLEIEALDPGTYSCRFVIRNKVDISYSDVNRFKVIE